MDPLDKAIADAHALDAELLQPEPGAAGADDPAAPQQPSVAQEITGALQIARNFPLLKKRFPRACAVLDDAQCEAFGAAAGAVCEKYGWSLGGFLGRWEAEIGAVITCGGIGWAVAEAAREDLDAAKATAAKSAGPSPAPASSAGSREVHFGTVIPAA
jgi:hypothetical protein